MGYNTRQREALLTYLSNAPGRHITVADVCAHFHERGETIGTTTVYRQLERLVDEGLVSKYILDGNTPACFEYVGAQAHRRGGRGQACFHCKCERCGRLIHMQCDELEGIGAHLYEHHGFALNPMRTVFYGVCGDCRAADGEGGAV